VLFARYDLEAAKAQLDRDALARRPRGMWRWFEIMPVRNPDHVVTLGEGDTPLLPAGRLGEALGSDKLWIKDEGLNPTGSFKARGLSAAVSKAKELGITSMAIPSAGNAAAALAAYGARRHADIPIHAAGCAGDDAQGEPPIWRACLPSAGLDQ
jgi:threonine synthase